MDFKEEPMATETYRLVMRSDLDGIVCAVLLRKLGLVKDDILFVHPKDMQDEKVDIKPNDITANLPFVEGVHLAFDHHVSETHRLGATPANYISDPNAPSTAHVIYNYYGGKAKFPDIPQELMDAVDKADSAQFTKDDVLNPQGWVLLHFLTDPRTGLGRFHHYRISNYSLMMEIIKQIETRSIAEVLAMPDVKERVDVYLSNQEQFSAQLKRCAKVHKNLVVLDLRKEEVIHAGNRFVIYALFPECNISMHVMWGKQKQNTAFAIGKSIFNRTSKTNIGDLALQYGGGGHAAAGTCQADNDHAEAVLQELIKKINADG
jgi:nanoRNase/pAp phosphatase (c-di-AMP/oligoRNAs hydrolase)